MEEFVPLNTKALLYKEREYVITGIVDYDVMRHFVFRCFIYNMNVSRLDLAPQAVEHGSVQKKGR
jgi:hypothetical protein